MNNHSARLAVWLAFAMSFARYKCPYLKLKNFFETVAKLHAQILCLAGRIEYVSSALNWLSTHVVSDGAMWSCIKIIIKM